MTCHPLGHLVNLMDGLLEDGDVTRYFRLVDLFRAVMVMTSVVTQDRHGPVSRPLLPVFHLQTIRSLEGVRPVDDGAVSDIVMMCPALGQPAPPVREGFHRHGEEDRHTDAQDEPCQDGQGHARPHAAILPAGTAASRRLPLDLDGAAKTSSDVRLRLVQALKKGAVTARHLRSILWGRVNDD